MTRLARLMPIPHLPQATLSSFSFLRRHSSHSLAIRPQRIHVSSSRWLRLEEAEELDTREEPLFLREPFMERMDLESASRSLGQKGGEGRPGQSMAPSHRPLKRLTAETRPTLPAPLSLKTGISTSVCHVRVGTCGSQKRALDVLALEWL